MKRKSLFSAKYMKELWVLTSKRTEKKGFRQYMKEHHPSCNYIELDLHAERNDEDNEMLDEFFQQHPNSEERNHIQL